MLDDRQAEAGAAAVPRASTVHPVEAFRQPRQVLRGDAIPRVALRGRGDRVACYLPMVAEVVVAMLATLMLVTRKVDWYSQGAAAP